MSLRSTRGIRSQQPKSSGQSNLQEALSTIQDLRQQLQKSLSVNQRLELRVRELTELTVKQSEADKILEDNKKLIAENERLIEKNERLSCERDESVRSERNAKRDAERTISRYEEKEADLDRIIRERAESRFQLWKREEEAGIQRRKNEAEIERERLWEHAQSQADALKNAAAQEAELERIGAEQFAVACRRRAVLYLIIVLLLGSIASGILTNRVINANQTKSIHSLEKTVEEQKELLEAEYYVCTYKKSIWDDQDDELTLPSSSDPDVTHRFENNDIVRYVGRVDDQDGFLSRTDYVVVYQGNKFIIPHNLFLLNFNRVIMPIIDES